MNRSALLTSVVLAGSLLAACSQPGGSGAGNAFAPNVAAGNVRSAVATPVIHSFGNGFDGAFPFAELLFHGGTFYGTTTNGGTNRTGTVFSIDPSTGKERVLHSFGPAGGPDGQGPQAGIVYASGALYGVTQVGGKYGAGTVFSVTLDGKEKVIYNFAGQPNDGSGPSATLLFYNGMLWGTTMYGGPNQNLGTMFNVTLDGHETVVHEFGKGSDGNTPSAPLIQLNGIIYGTTLFGSVTQGTLFSYKPATKFYHILHQFNYQGERPSGIAFGPNNVIYGITGGAPNAVGQFYSCELTGKYKMLYTFLGDAGHDVVHPYGTIAWDGKHYFYFTGAQGGVYNEGGVVKITDGGMESVLYSFGTAGTHDGSEPNSGPILAGGNLYGATRVGGAFPYDGLGGGTVYKLRP